MHGVDDDADTLRLQHGFDALCDLGRQLLLHLESTGEGIHDPCQLADPDDLVVRQITDVCLADDGRHMVFAMRFEVDAAQDDHLVVSLDLLERALQEGHRVALITAEPVLVGLHDATRRIDESLTLRILPRPSQQRRDGVFRLSAARSCGAFAWGFLAGQGTVLLPSKDR
jgi:hypothetical protein